jgi:hypothetical protein
MAVAESQGTNAASTARLLSQVVKAEKGVKIRVNEAISALYKAIQKTGEKGPMEGLHRTYQPRFDDGVAFPEEYRRVQYSAEGQLGAYFDELRGLLDVTATKDFGNAKGTASVVVGDVVIVENAPPTFLLSLEQALTNLRTFITTLPTLDPATQWEWSPEADAFAARPVGTVRTEKVNVPVTLAPATDRHAAQVQMVTEDRVIGQWTTVKFSGYVKGDRVKELSDRVDRLLTAVKFAREEANASTEVELVRVGAAVQSYIFG